MHSASARRPPRLLVRTTAVTFLTVAILLLIVFVLVTMNIRDQVRASVVANLASGQRIFGALEARQQRELQTQAATVAENPTLKAALYTYEAEAKTSDPESRRELVATIDRELEKIAARMDADAFVLADARNQVLAAAGREAALWPAGHPLAFGGRNAFDGVVHVDARVFRVVAVPLSLDEVEIASLYLMRSLDRRYAEELATLAGAQTAILSGRLLVGTTLPDPAARAFESYAAHQHQAEGTAMLAGQTYAFRRLVSVGDAAFYALASIDESSRPALAAAVRSLVLLGLGALVLALGASVWLARMVTRPIDQLSASVAALARRESREAQLPMTGSSRELDLLTEAFNGLIASLWEAEAQTEAAYTGAIRALATALDARDPYTAGHSERVSVLAVAIGRALDLTAAQLEVIRLGALLHDIGKIGIPDDVLRSPRRLTDAEFELIKQHPVLGARILRSVPFLAEHLPIVELHHERPDGRGYPHGLRGDDIPLPARIVHVADAFDAITSARAYRAARPAADALSELWRCAGTEFHAEIVAALATALPGVTLDAARDQAGAA